MWCYLAVRTGGGGAGVCRLMDAAGLKLLSEPLILALQELQLLLQVCRPLHTYTQLKDCAAVVCKLGQAQSQSVAGSISALTDKNEQKINDKN